MQLSAQLTSTLGKYYPQSYNSLKYFVDNMKLIYRSLYVNYICFHRTEKMDNNELVEETANN